MPHDADALVWAREILQFGMTFPLHNGLLSGLHALVDQNKQVVVSGDRSPADLEYMDERMRSRLSWGLVAEVHAKITTEDAE